MKRIFYESLKAKYQYYFKDLAISQLSFRQLYIYDKSKFLKIIEVIINPVKKILCRSSILQIRYFEGLFICSPITH